MTMRVVHFVLRYVGFVAVAGWGSGQAIDSILAEDMRRIGGRRRRGVVDRVATAAEPEV